MSNIQLSCNLPSCRKKLNNQACVTTCLHIFCLEHMPATDRSGNGCKCLACGTHFNSDLNFAQTNLNPSDQYKTLVLAGLNPDQVLEAATNAINFFVYQLNYDNRNKENMLQYYKNQTEELKQYCDSLTSKYKSDLHKYQKTVKDLKREIEEKIRVTEMQQQHIAQCQRENKKLRMQQEHYKRELAHPGTNIIQSSPFTTSSHSSRNSHFKLRYPGYSDFCTRYNAENFGSAAELASPFNSNLRFST